MPSIGDDDELSNLLENTDIGRETSMRKPGGHRRPPEPAGPDAGPPAIELDGFEGFGGFEPSAVDEIDALDLSAPLDLSELGELGDADPAEPVDDFALVSSSDTATSAERAASISASGSFSFESSAESDLPAPVESLDLPAPVEIESYEVEELDLPAPATSAKRPPPVQKNGSTAGHGASIAAALEELDLPAPVDSADLPSPRGAGKPLYALELDEMLDLPMPSDGMSDLPKPREHLDVAPRDMGVAPREMGVAPRGPGSASTESIDAGALELEPIGLDLEPALDSRPEPSSASVERPAHDSAAVHAQIGTPITRSPSPAPRPEPRKLPPRPVLFGGLALVTAAALAGSLYAAGLFGEPSTDTVARTAPQQAPSEAVPAGPAKPRSETVLSALRRDTLSSYREAYEAAGRDGDAVGQAEAALLMHLRYGPDPVQLGRATQLLELYGGETALHTKRVHALRELVRGNAEPAAALDPGDDAQALLYVAMAELSRGHADAALETVKTIRARVPEHVGALAVELEAKLANGDAGEALEKAIAKHPEHTGFRRLAARSALRNGYIREADAHAEAIPDDEQASAQHRASIEHLHAEIAHARGDLVSAKKHLDKAAELAPESSEVHLARVRLRLARGDLLGAANEVEHWSNEHPSDVRAKFIAAEVALTAGDGDRALALADELAEASAENYEAALLRGKVFGMRGQIEESSAAFDAARKLQPHSVEVEAAHARAHVTSRQNKEALDVLDHAYKRWTKDRVAPRLLADLLTQKAELLFEQGQRNAADTVLASALALVPDHNDAQLRRGLIALETGNNTRGRADLLAIYDRTGGYPGLTAPLGRIFAREGKLESLAKLIGAQNDLSSASSEIKLVAARLHLGRGELDAAKQLVEAILAADPNAWEGHLLMAQVLVLGGDYQAALAAIERSKPRSPQAEVHLQRGKILEYNARHEEAVPEYQKALALDESLHEARFLHGRLLAYRGSVQAAAAELQRVTEATDVFPEAWLYLGRAQRELGRPTQALENLQRATKMNPRLYEAHYHAGRILYERNRHAQAAASLQKAVEGGTSDAPWYADAWMFLGRASVKAGQRGPAKLALERFLLIAPQNHPSRREAERQLREL